MRWLFLAGLTIGCAAAAETTATSPTEAPSLDDKDGDDPLAPSPVDDATPAPTRNELIQTFAPHVHLHPADVYRPANVDWYLARVRLRFHHDNCADHGLIDTGKVTQQVLVAQKHEENGSLCRHDDNKLVTSTASESFFLEVADHETYKGAPRSEWKTYVVWRPRLTGGLVDIEYWLFYAFNDGFLGFNHESDWEHVRVTIEPKAAKLVEVKLSAHKGGTILKAGDASLQLDGTHPVSYAAKGTHANYPRPGTYEIEGTSGVAKDEAKAASDVWKTETALVEVGTRAAPKNGQVFVKYWGRWGELGDTPESNGVRRHFP